MLVARNSLPWCLVLGLAIVASGQDYVFTDLGTLGGDSTETHAINNSGQIVGYSVGAPSVATKAFSYKDGIMTDLGTLGGGGSSANAINNRGQIVGAAQTENNATQRAFIYYKGVMSDLGIGSPDSAARGISENGIVVGQYLADTGFLRGFKHRDGVTVDLGTLGGNFTQAIGVNNAGQITGQSSTETQIPRAFLYQDGSMSDVGTLGGNFSQGTAINNNGVVVGTSTTVGDAEFRAFASVYGVNFDLGSLGGSSLALGINDDGDVVGGSFAGPGTFDDLRPVLFRSGQVVDLSGNLPGWSFTLARSINENGQIVGDGFTLNGERHGFLLTPVPVP